MLILFTAITTVLLRQLKSADEQLFLIINQTHSPWGDQIAYWVTHNTFWIPLYTLLLGYIIKTFQKKTWIVLVAIIVLITLCDQFASSVAKPLIHRLRPCFNPTLAGKVHVVGQHHGLYGFISSHAANTVGLVAFVWLTLQPKFIYKILLCSWAITISYARVYGGVHYPGDVIAGALTGALWGWLVYKLCQKYTRLLQPEQVLRNGNAIS